MDEDFEKFKADERVPIDIAKSIVDRVSILSELVEMSDSIPEETKARFKDQFTMPLLVDSAVSSFLDAFTEEFDTLFDDN